MHWFSTDQSCICSTGKKTAAKKSKNPNIRAPGSKPKNIKSMFAAAAATGKTKPKPEVVLSAMQYKYYCNG